MTRRLRNQEHGFYKVVIYSHPVPCVNHDLCPEGGQYSQPHEPTLGKVVSEPQEKRIELSHGIFHWKRRATAVVLMIRPLTSMSRQ